MLNGREHFYPVFADAVRGLARRPLVLDLGTSARFLKEMAPFAGAFAGRYLAMGHRAPRSLGDRNVDVDGDIHALPFRDGCADGVICLEVLEHVPEPQHAVREIHRILAPGGAALAIAPFSCAYHAKAGHYPDFWRFTHEGLHHLFRGFGRVEVTALGGVAYRLLLAAAPRRLQQLVETRLGMHALNLVDRRWPTRSPVLYLVVAEK